jgi:hypothetical protein
MKTFKLFFVFMFAFAILQTIDSQKKIAFVTNAWDKNVSTAKPQWDSTTVDAFIKKGYKIDTITDRNLDNLSDSATNVFYQRLMAADLIFVSRSTNSGNYDGPSIANWGTITKPVIITNSYTARANRMKLFPTTSTGIINLDTNITAKFFVKDDYILKNVNLKADSTVLFYNDRLNFVIFGADSLQRKSNWKLIATGDTLKGKMNNILIARLDTGIESYTGSGLKTKSEWTFISLGGAEQSKRNNFQLTEAGKIILFNEIKRLIGDDASLCDIKANGTTIPFFNSETYTYVWPANDGIPVITATANDERAKIDIDAATSNSDSTIITVTAKNGTDKKVYTIVMTVEDATLEELKIDGVLIKDFNKDKLSYTVAVKNIPNITAKANDSKANITIENATGIPGTSKVIVKTGSTTLTYSINLIKYKSSNANLKSISTSIGTIIPVFNPDTLNYKVMLPIASTMPSNISAELEDTTAKMSISQALNISLVAKVSVTAEDGITEKIYTITFEVIKSTDADLKNITTNIGTLIPVFHKDTLNYKVELPQGSKVPSTITVTANYPTATFKINSAKTLSDTTIITVTAEDGITQKIYKVVFYIKSNIENKRISDILINQNNVSKYINIQCDAQWIGAVIKIVDITGKVVFCNIINDNNLFIPTLLFKDGIYLIQLNKNDEFLTRKIMIRK